MDVWRYPHFRKPPYIGTIFDPKVSETLNPIHAVKIRHATPNVRSRTHRWAHGKEPQASWQFSG